MKIIGLTGGMGAGKSLVARIFETLGVPVFYADLESKQLLDKPALKEKLRDRFGAGIFNAEDKIDRRQLASMVFRDGLKLDSLNQILHPEVKSVFDHWIRLHQASPFVVREAAILFESGSYRDCDRVITVSAPEELRISRCIQRDHITREEAVARMVHQWTDEQRREASDFEIINDDLTPVLPQVLEIFGLLG